VLNQAASSPSQIVVWLLCTCGILVQAIRWRVQVQRLRRRERAARDIQHALVQNTQALIVRVHGAIQDLHEDDATRRRIVRVLDSADEQLSQISDQVQDLQLRRDNGGG
jgi:hypothetical protein